MLPQQDECHPRFYLGKDEVECGNTALMTGNEAANGSILSGGTVVVSCYRNLKLRPAGPLGL